MAPPPLRRALDYVVALVLPVVATAVRWALGQSLGHRLGLPVYSVAVVLTSINGGLGPGLVCVVLSAFLSVAYVEEHFVLFQMRADDVSLLTMFVLANVMIAAICEARRRAIMLAEHSHGEAIAKQEELEQEVRERSAMEHDLRVARVELEQRVRERTRELEEANLKLREVDRMKSEFIGTMSHELRTPLNSILGFTELVLTESVGPLNEDQKRQLKHVYEAGRQLLDLIADILDVTRIEAGKMDLSWQRFLLFDVVETSVKSVHAAAIRKNLSVIVHEVDPSQVIESDPTKLTQILVSLLTNAVKFTRAGGIEVRCEVAAQRVSIHVRDTGIGIASEVLDRLFLPFEQLDSSHRRLYEGTGLGLYICKRLCELLEGEILVQSELGKGSTFTVSIPLQAQAAVRAEAEVIGHGGGS